MIQVGWQWTSGAAGGAAVRRGPSARGRARVRGRRLWWLVAVLNPW